MVVKHMVDLGDRGDVDKKYWNKSEYSSYDDASGSSDKACLNSKTNSQLHLGTFERCLRVPNLYVIQNSTSSAIT